MTFYDTIAERGYLIKKEENNKIIHIIKSDNDILETHIFFNLTDKTVLGCLRPKNLFYDLDDICLIYRMYREMVEDLKFFADKSKYDII